MIPPGTPGRISDRVIVYSVQYNKKSKIPDANITNISMVLRDKSTCMIKIGLRGFVTLASGKKLTHTQSFH